MAKSLMLPALTAAFALAACGETSAPSANVATDSSAEQANHISSEPFGASGAPGADLTDNGVTDGANGFATNETGNLTE
ncbi:hypothetical protein MZO42_20315 [Sphingomonas psychrotolerans]|uniref:Lipoprotein n=1 Tax=Sphingomonas psychrotolerans TaxID=1327635 RepID=A0ABU3N9R2_9SPHN|nr:hypothetical protein [Sphingomonas psychrotolerans]MDT8761051.1 hypothetical protein [Sphingomonas psychrotolerans]